MTASTVTLTPGTGLDTAPGAGACAETPTSPSSRHDLTRALDDTMGPDSRGSVARTVIERAHRSDVSAWLGHVRAAAGCSNPVRLAGTIERLNQATGEVVHRVSTQDMPDGAIYKACGNRRASACPHCAEVYRRDAFQLIRAGMIGGKGVDTCVSTHPAVFAAFTAPSFGLVHGPRQTTTGQPARCRARRTPDLCPHGVDLRCTRIHGKDEHINGTPLCPDCYDYAGQAVWNHHAGELWRRTIGVALQRYLDRLTRRLGLIDVKANGCKVAEFQTRGVIHFHAVFRLDGIDPNTGQFIAPPAELDVIDLSDAIRYAVKSTAFNTDPHPDRPEGWRIGWGDHADNPTIRPIQLRGDAEITDSLVAGYLAKYATKSTEATGHVSRRLNPESIDLYADPDGTHTQRLIDACWRLGAAPGWRGLRAWAHMLGFGGHFLTKTRGYSVTFRLLRDTRIIWRRTVEETPAVQAEDQDTITVVNLDFIGQGWHTLGDAMLANTSAAMAREQRQVAREELAHLHATGQL